MTHDKVQAVTSNVPEDVRLLQQTYALSKLSYLNIAEEERMANIIKRWPLLEELATPNQE